VFVYLCILCRACHVRRQSNYLELSYIESLMSQIRPCILALVAVWYGRVLDMDLLVQIWTVAIAHQGLLSLPPLWAWVNQWT